MSKKIADFSFPSETEARQYASTISRDESSRWYVIQTADVYFVTTTKSLQPYETLVASYFEAVI